MNLEPIKKTSVVEQAIEKMYQLIKEQNLRANDKLPSERELSSMLGISRNSMREALRVLEMIGVIKVEHGSGMVIDVGKVSDAVTRPLSFALLINREKMNELFEARLIVETACAGLAAERATDEEIDALNKAYEKLYKYQFERAKGIQCELALHDLIAKASHNDLLQRIISSLRQVLRESREMSVPSSGVTPATVESQRQIIESIGRHDAATARELMREHISAVAERVQRGVEAKLAQEQKAQESR